MLALIPRYFSLDQWAQSLQPVSDAEKLMASMMAPSLTARSGTTLFERDARNLARDISKNLLSYCQISTDAVDRTGKETIAREVMKGRIMTIL
jgi:nuclear pore complex protein Nup205